MVSGVFEVLQDPFLMQANHGSDWLFFGFAVNFFMLSVVPVVESLILLLVILSLLLLFLLMEEL